VLILKKNVKMNRLIILFSFTLILLGCTVLNILPSKKITKLSFDNELLNPDYQFYFPNPNKDSIIFKIKESYPIEDVVKDVPDEQTKILLAQNWVRNQWEHNGWNDANTNNAFTILKRAEQGEEFRCVEYGIVLKSVLATIGMKSRTLGLMTHDVERVKFGAGHFLTEVWLNDHKKWAMVDAQFDVMPILNNVPLNAVEFQSAIIEKKEFSLINHNGKLSPSDYKKYMDFIPHYLYYFTISFDESNIDTDRIIKFNGNSNLMLVPLGSKEPRIFQRKYPIDYAEYTSSLNDFYREPKELYLE
jgi:hypothetical protein